MPYNQDRPYDHFLRGLGPKHQGDKSGSRNIPEKKAGDMGGMQGKEPPVDWGKIEKGQRGENESVFRPWESEGDGDIGTSMRGESARKPFEGEGPGKGRSTMTKGED